MLLVYIVVKQLGYCGAALMEEKGKERKESCEAIGEGWRRGAWMEILYHYSHEQITETTVGPLEPLVPSVFTAVRSFKPHVPGGRTPWIVRYPSLHLGIPHLPTPLRPIQADRVRISPRPIVSPPPSPVQPSDLWKTTQRSD